MADNQDPQSPQWDALTPQQQDEVNQAAVNSAYKAGRDRQLNLIMFMLNDLAPGCVCFDSRCPEASILRVPHMANDHGPHPHPYGVIESQTHEWRKKRRWRRG
jgi:hypothetical protein